MGRITKRKTKTKDIRKKIDPIGEGGKQQRKQRRLKIQLTMLRNLALTCSGQVFFFFFFC